MHGIVLFAHGARDPEWARPFEAIRDRIRTARPECPIDLAYLEIQDGAFVLRERAPGVSIEEIQARTAGNRSGS